MNCAKLYHKITKLLVILTLLPCLFLAGCFGKDEKPAETNGEQAKEVEQPISDGKAESSGEDAKVTTSESREQQECRLDKANSGEHTENSGVVANKGEEPTSDAADARVSADKREEAAVNKANSPENTEASAQVKDEAAVLNKEGNNSLNGGDESGNNEKNDSAEAGNAGSNE